VTVLLAQHTDNIGRKDPLEVRRSDELVERAPL
jgi:hypothetical protein